MLFQYDIVISALPDPISADTKGAVLPRSMDQDAKSASEAVVSLALPERSGIGEHTAHIVLCLLRLRPTLP